MLVEIIQLISNEFDNLFSKFDDAKIVTEKVGGWTQGAGKPTERVSFGEGATAFCVLLAKKGRKMLNLYSTIREMGRFQKIEVNELMFVEYTCLAEATQFGIWSNNNYFAFISSGKKIWRSIYHSYEVNDGDIIFVKKGANLAHQFFDDEFCAIFIFIPDEFIREFLNRNASFLDTPQKDLSGQDAVLRIEKDELLKNYYQSVRAYLSLSEIPRGQLLLHKFEELLLSLFSNRRHQHLTDYFISLCQSRKQQMDRIMEANFAYNLKLENYASLCHMSLSSFKRSFKQLYNTTPAAWLQIRKLDLAQHLLLSSGKAVNEISFDCGFEDASHFARVFKQKYLHTPHQYRLRHASAVADKQDILAGDPESVSR